MVTTADEILCAHRCKPREDEGDDWQHCLLLECEANDRLKREDPTAYEAMSNNTVPTDAVMALFSTLETW